jgi:predicted lysophospholipase L1 biosynthesis ABC-type transport system permease subunit
LGYRLVAVLAGFVISIVFAGIVYRILEKVGPFGVKLDDVNKDPVATSLYVLGYLMFLGAILYACLLIPV